MRVALLASGTVIHSRRWFEALVDRGLDIKLFTLEPPPADFAARAGSSLVLLPSQPLPGLLRYPLAGNALERELERFQPQILDAHFVPNYGLLGALSGRRPLVVNCWGSDLLMALDGLRRARARWVLSRADRVLVDADSLARAARRLGVRDDRLRVIPWGVDSKLFPFTADAAQRKSVRSLWPESWRQAISDAATVVVSTRALDPFYDVGTLVRAWSRLVRHREARCLVIGDGDERGALEKLARDCGVSDSVVFLGRIPHGILAKLLAGADLYVSTSRSDSTSLSLLEAMSAGCFPLVTDIEGNREWLDDRGARFFPVGDVERLAEVLDLCIGAAADSGKSAELDDARRQNRRRVVEDADWHGAIDQVIGEFETLLAATD